MRRIVRGQRTAVPPELMLHLVASTYGQSPAAVRRWPAADWWQAGQVLSATRTVGIPMGEDDV